MTRPPEPTGSPDRARLLDRIRARATPRAVLAALGLYLLSVAALSMSDAQMAAHAPDMTKLDLRFGYDRTQALALLTALGQAGRRAYRLNLVMDTLMPVAFAAATVLVAARAAPRWLSALAVAPVLFLLLDLLENAAFAVMLAQYPDISPALVSVTSPVTAIKLSAFFVALPTLAVGALTLGVGWLRQRVRARRNDEAR